MNLFLFFSAIEMWSQRNENSVNKGNEQDLKTGREKKRWDSYASYKYKVLPTSNENLRCVLVHIYAKQPTLKLSRKEPTIKMFSIIAGKLFYYV